MLPRWMLPTVAGVVIARLPVAATSAAGAACPTTCYKHTCDHWVAKLGHSCEALQTTDLCDCSGCICAEPGSAQAAEAVGASSASFSRAGHGAHADADAKFDCMTGLSNWQGEWPADQQKWCCHEEGVACPFSGEASDVEEPFNCLLGIEDWRARWDTDKRAWCCQNRGLGCAPAARTSASPGVDSGALPSTSTATVVRPSDTATATTSASFTASAAIEDTTGSTSMTTSAPATSTMTSTAASVVTASATTQKDADESFNCLDGVKHWQSGWSTSKRRWCCAREGLGCKLAADRSALSCLERVDHWRELWAAEKKKRCCREEGLGCPSHPPKKAHKFNCLIGIEHRDANWSKVKKTWCCNNQGLGCPHTAEFDCFAGLENWRLGWSGQKKQWCCKNEGLGCQPTEAIEADTERHGARASPAMPGWWLLLGVPQAGEDGFSEEQQRAFGVDGSGELLDPERFDAEVEILHRAMFTGLPGDADDPPPWWSLYGVHPAGYTKHNGKYAAVVFTKQQQEHFGIGEDGVIRKEGRLQGALHAMKAAHAGHKGDKAWLPDWWVLAGVAPAGHDHGHNVTFSKAQQDQFGVDRLGRVEDRARFEASTQAMWAPARAGNGSRPWWVFSGVQPISFQRVGSEFRNVTFSLRQQEAIGIDERGEPVDLEMLENIMEPLGPGRQAGGESHALPQWWLPLGVLPRGWYKRAGQPPVPIFSKVQESYFGVDQRGRVTNRTRFLAATALRTPPEWWVLAGVQPKGVSDSSDKAAFDELQQERFGVAADGRVVDQDIFDAAIHALRAAGIFGPDPLQEHTPWWIANHVMPSSFRKDLGRYLQVTFSLKQQRQFGISASGEVTDRDKREFVIRMLSQGKTLQQASEMGHHAGKGDDSDWKEVVNKSADNISTPAQVISPGAGLLGGSLLGGGLKSESGNTSAKPSDPVDSAHPNSSKKSFELATNKSTDPMTSAADLDSPLVEEMKKAMQKAERMRSHALAKLNLTVGSRHGSLFAHTRGFDPSQLGVASSGQVKAHHLLEDVTESSSGNWTEQASEWIQGFEHHKFLKSACDVAAAAMRHRSRADALTHAKVACSQLIAERHHACSVAAWAVIAAADEQAGELLRHGCRLRLGPGLPNGTGDLAPSAAMLLGDLNSSLGAKLMWRKHSTHLYQEGIDAAVEAVNDSAADLAFLTDEGKDPVFDVACNDATDDHVWDRVLAAGHEMAYECGASAAGATTEHARRQASNICLEAGFSGILRAAYKARDCRVSACEAFLPKHSHKKDESLTDAAHAAAQSFQAVSAASCAPADGSLADALAREVAAAAAKGSAVAGHGVAHEVRYLNEKFLARPGAANAALDGDSLARVAACLVGLVTVAATVTAVSLRRRRQYDRLVDHVNARSVTFLPSAG